MRTRGFALVAGAGLAVVTTSATRVDAQEHVALPPVNLGGSSFMDAVGGPGLLVRQAVGVYEAQRFVGSNGAYTPGSNSVFAFTSITHLAYAAPFKVLGGYWGGEVLVPVVYASVTTPVGSGSIGGVGDITFSPVIWQAPNTTVLGRPFFQFVNLDVVAPTGEYKSSALVTAGSNVWSFNPFYAFTWLLTDRLETSWRLHYLWNSVNNSPGPGYGATSIQPGQAVHFNGAASFAIVSWLRAGIADVCLAGNCTVDSDCGSGGYCSPSYGTSCGAYGGVVGYFCHTAKDQCTNDDQCVDSGSGYSETGYCGYQPTTGQWTCFYSFCAG